MLKVSTYLNFPNNTEEAFNFYKSVFKTEFAGMGVVRFGDMPQDPGLPANPRLKNLIMHVELPITASHSLMGTDAPEEMGFQIHFGNNVLINLQPDTRTETKRLFEALSESGKIIVPLQNMSWGAYFGTCIDRFGVNWMFNYNEVKN